MPFFNKISDSLRYDGDVLLGKYPSKDMRLLHSKLISIQNKLEEYENNAGLTKDSQKHFSYMTKVEDELHNMKEIVSLMEETVSLMEEKMSQFSFSPIEPHPH